MTSKSGPSLTAWIGYIVEFSFLLLFSVVVMILPWSMVRSLGRGLGWLIYHLKLRRNVSERNLKRAFPDWDRKQRLTVLRRCYQHWGAEFFLIQKVWLARRRSFERQVEKTEWGEVIARYQESSRPTLYYTAHVGNWEVLGRFIVSHARRSAAIYRKQKNPLVDRWMVGLRRARGFVLVDSWSGMSQYLRTLREINNLCIVGDQYKGAQGVVVPFMDVPSATAKGTAVMTFKVKPRVVYLTAMATPKGYRIDGTEVPYELPAELTEDWIRDFTAVLMEHLTVTVRRAPEQYFWFHRRWRDLDRKEPIPLVTEEKRGES